MEKIIKLRVTVTTEDGEVLESSIIQAPFHVGPSAHLESISQAERAETRANERELRTAIAEAGQVYRDALGMAFVRAKNERNKP
jgi:hypothetical protein